MRQKVLIPRQAARGKECDIRTRFQRDRDRILYSKAFRRLKHKTQVFLSPEGIITDEAYPYSWSFADSEDYCQKPKIKWGFDWGNSFGTWFGTYSFGHAGERVLNEICPMGLSITSKVSGLWMYWKKTMVKPYMGGKRRNTQSHRKHHSSTLEGQIIRYADRIAYINHDIDDAIRGGIISETVFQRMCQSIG